VREKKRERHVREAGFKHVLGRMDERLAMDMRNS
jgi:hypothetical protein